MNNGHAYDQYLHNNHVVQDNQSDMNQNGFHYQIVHNNIHAIHHLPAIIEENGEIEEEEEEEEEEIIMEVEGRVHGGVLFGEEGSGDHGGRGVAIMRGGDEDDDLVVEVGKREYGGVLFERGETSRGVVDQVVLMGVEVHDDLTVDHVQDQVEHEDGGPLVAEDLIGEVEDLIMHHVQDQVELEVGGLVAEDLQVDQAVHEQVEHEVGRLVAVDHLMVEVEAAEEVEIEVGGDIGEVGRRGGDEEIELEPIRPVVLQQQPTHDDLQGSQADQRDQVRVEFRAGLKWVTKLGLVLLGITGLVVLGYHEPATTTYHLTFFATQNSTLHHFSFNATESSFSVGFSFTLSATLAIYRNTNFTISVIVQDFVLVFVPLVAAPTRLENNHAYWVFNIDKWVKLTPYELYSLSPLIENRVFTLDVRIENTREEKEAEEQITRNTVCPIQVDLTNKSLTSLPCFLQSRR